VNLGKGRGSSGRGSPLPPRVAIPEWQQRAWEPAREAWGQRGLALPPSPAQRRLLWPVVVAHPNEVGDWIAEAPRDEDNDTTYSIVSHVLARARTWQTREQRAVLWEGLSDDERTRWLAIERNGSGATARDLRQARVEGLGLPLSDPPFNPYREMLREAEENLESFRLRFVAPRGPEEEW
jgi:hypothetical protein